MESSSIDPIRRVPIGELPSTDEPDPDALNTLPVEVLQVILEKLEEFPKESETSRLWYKTIVSVCQQKGFHQIKEALNMIIPELEKTDDGKNKSTAEELKKILSGKELLTNLSTRFDFENAQKKIQRDIILILKQLEIDNINKICRNLLKSQGIADIDNIPLNDYPLFAKLLLSAYHEMHLEGRDPRYDFPTYRGDLFAYAKFTKDEDMLINFGKLFRNPNNCYNFILEGLLEGRNVDNIKTAMRMMSKLEPLGYKFEYFIKATFFSVNDAIGCLLINNKINLILKFAEVFGESKIKETYELFIAKLSEGKKSEVLQEVIKQLNESDGKDYQKERILQLILNYCISSLFVEEKIEDGFKLIDELYPNKNLGLENFFHSETGLAVRFREISRENQMLILGEVIKQINNVDHFNPGFTQEDYRKEDDLKSFLNNRLSSFFVNGKIEDGFKIIDKLIALDKDNMHVKFEVGTYFRAYLAECIPRISMENLIKIRERIIANPDLVDNPSVKEFLKRMKDHEDHLEYIKKFTE